MWERKGKTSSAGKTTCRESTKARKRLREREYKYRLELEKGQKVLGGLLGGKGGGRGLKMWGHDWKLKTIEGLLFQTGGEGGLTNART